MDKPIKDWTLSEAQEYCRAYMAALKKGYCEESDCELVKRGICRKEWVHDWNLDAFTQEEIDDARAILRLFPHATIIRRENDRDFVIKYNGNYLFPMDCNLFPSIKVGQTVNLLDIINS